MSGGKRKTERADARGGRFFMMPHCLLTSEAYRTASPRAVKVLQAFCAKHNGFNNGAIGIGFRELAERVGSQNHKANCLALCELQERGLVALERSYPRGQRLANEYRLTFVETADAPATNDYLTWKLGDAGTRKKAQGRNLRASGTSTRTPLSVSKTSTGEETSRCENLNGVHENPPFPDSPPVSITSAHIVQPSEAQPQSASQSVRITGGPLSAAPDAEVLRARVLSVLAAAPRGSQGQLAALAAIRPAALSKFLSNGGSLNDPARIRLTLALPKIGQQRSRQKAPPHAGEAITSGWWSAAHVARARVGAHLSMLAWIASEPTRAAA